MVLGMNTRGHIQKKSRYFLGALPGAQVTIKGSKRLENLDWRGVQGRNMGYGQYQRG